MKLVRPPYPVRKLYYSLVWRIPTKEKKIFLTFDDGPIPIVTPWVLDTLEKHKAKATFFCIGNNIEKHPEVFQQLLAHGHAVGNHTYNHLNGWKTSNDKYFTNIEKCDSLVKSELFRPPYGKLKRSQLKKIPSLISLLGKERCPEDREVQSQISLPIAIGSQSSIIMWDVLSYDYDKTVSPEKCLSNVLQHAREGSIIVFHDSLKAWTNLEYALPRVLEYFSAKGFRFEAL